jgi:hypothetical protein
MSLEVLPSVRDDEEQFLLLCKAMKTAIAELKIKITSIDEPASAIQPIL